MEERGKRKRREEEERGKGYGVPEEERGEGCDFVLICAYVK